MKTRLPALALLFGNFVVGVTVLAPAGMLGHLARGLDVSIAEAGLLVTFGAVVVCVGSPLISWLTSHLDRRTMLAGSLLLIALGNLASALAPGYTVLLVVRLLMMAAAAPFTPQAAGTIALLVSEKDRPRAIAFVFLGWTLAVAAGLPIMGMLAEAIGWRAAYGAVALTAAASWVLIAIGIPAGLRGAVVSLRSWAAIGRNRVILLLLLVTAVQVSGQFAIFTYLAPLLETLAGAGAATVGMFFLIAGITGFIGNVIATRIVTGLGALQTTYIFLLSILVGVVLWTLGAGSIVVMGAGVTLWGLGFAAVNSMQQARLVAAAPDLAGGSVALNTSAIYVGQAVGSAIGGFLLARGEPIAIGYAGIASVAASLLLLALTRRPGEMLWGLSRK